MTTHPTAVERINPSCWNAVFRYDQAQVRPAPTRLLTLAGQGAVSAAGVPSDGDMVAQLGLALDNVEQLLAAGGMDLTDVLSLTVHVTDMDAALASYQVVTERLDGCGATPPATLVEVRRLALPSMLVEITATAGR